MTPPERERLHRELLLAAAEVESDGLRLRDSLRRLKELKARWNSQPD